jgi:hypothetical protein
MIARIVADNGQKKGRIIDNAALFGLVRGLGRNQAILVLPASSP